MKIPKLIHRIWLGGHMPAIFYKYGHLLEEHLKGWKFILWTDQNVEYDGWEVRQIQTLMPFRNDYAYRKALTTSARINILKTEILYRFGGVHIDCTFECLKNFEPIIGGLEAFVELDNENYSVNNSIMGCTQGHPWMRHIIDQIPKERNDILQQGLRLIERVSLCHDVALFDYCTFHTPYPTKPVTNANESSRNEHLFLELKEKNVHYEAFVLTQTHRQDMARRMVKSLIDHAAEKPSRILVASMEDISDNWGPGVEIWAGANRIKVELLNAGLSKEAFSRIAGNGSEAGIRSKWNLGNGHMFLKYAIPRLCMGKRVLVSDDDVIFRGPCSELFASGADMVFMDDPPGFYGGESIRLFLENCWSNEVPQGPFVCAGFYLMNKKQATPEMVNKVILNAKNHRDEQSAVGMEAMMGTIHILQPPKYIHGGQVCDRRIEAKSEIWIKDAEVIHMQGHLDYLRGQDIKPIKPKNKSNIVLMTSSILVSPNVLVLKPHKICDPVLRLKQYLYCLLRWAKSNAYGVVFCDNSGIKMNTELLLNYYEAFGTKLEILLFKEESNSRFYGFLEQRLLHYAIQNSRLLEHETSFFKVTGRLFVENYDTISEKHFGDNMVFNTCTDCASSLDSRFFKIDHNNCLDFIRRTSEKEYEFLTIEKLLSQKLSCNLVNFRYNPIIVGRSGGPDNIWDKDYDCYYMKEASNLAPSVIHDLF